jgi:hypothetical protein
VFAVRRLSRVMAGVIVTLALAVSAAAQGNSGYAPGKNKDKKGTAPSSSPLPAPTSTVAGSSPISTVTGASPLSWVDDASLLEPGSAMLTVSAIRWSGSGLSEVDFPIVDATVGLTRRVQFGATVPRVVGGAEGTGIVGGLGTSYFSAKVALLPDSKVRVAVSPLLEILGTGAVQSLPEGESRYQLGVPVSIEAGSGAVRMFAAAGFFTRGAWFAGGGTAFQLTPEVGASIAFTRSWASTDVEGLRRDRGELSGGVSYFLTSHVAVYGSLGHTIATSAENGAGMTVGGGVTFLLIPGGVTK